VTVSIEPAKLNTLTAAALQRVSQAASVGVLADATAQCVRDLTGHDRVMVYKFDADGHGKIIAEARDPRLESLLGHRYPASDIPQRARQLYLRNRVRVLLDVNCSPAPLLPASLDDGPPDLDMSMCHLRSMSPLHLQYLKNMGVTATLVVSLVREGQLWGLIAAHHYAPHGVSYPIRATCDMLAEVVSSRITALENYAHAQVAVLVRRLERRLIEATSTEGDWRLALFRHPHTLLQPLEATGAALFYDDEVLTVGEVPSTPELRQLHAWVATKATDLPFACATLAKANPALESLTPTASGVLAVRLSATRPDYLMWMRKEQLHSVTWAGDPSKPMIGNNPLELSPRRSFAIWSEIVRGSSAPWTTTDVALGRAVGLALVDIIAQVHAVRLLIAEHTLSQLRTTVSSSVEPVLIADAQGRLLSCNPAFATLADQDAAGLENLQDLALVFTQPQTVRKVFGQLKNGQPTWRGELAIARESAESIPVTMRAERVPGRDGSTLGYFVILFDLRQTKRAAAARRHLEQSIALAGRALAGDTAVGAGAPVPDPVLCAIFGNARLAAMDIADNTTGPPAAPLLEELEAATQRAAALYARIRDLGGSGG
jgi:light-regulated signal transduction histidine kinase (bacteriophytochrome)